MTRFSQWAAAALLLAGTALHAGCASTGISGLTTGSVGPADAPAITNDDPMARPVQVAWTSARATRCGFYFDPGKLKSSYIAYEAKQGAAGEQLASIEKSYDSTLKVISERVSADPDYCTDRKGAEIKADLQRHLAGDYTPNLPKPRPVASTTCAAFDCGGSSSEKFDQKKVWTDIEKNMR